MLKCVYLLRQPADVFERAVRVRVTQKGVNVDERLWQQRSDVCVNGCEPAVSTGPVFTPQHHGVLTVWRVKLQQPVKHVQKSVTFTVTYSIPSILSSDIITLSHRKTPVFQVRHCKVSADVAHFERNDLSVTGHATLGRLIAAAVFWRLKIALPGLCAHRGLLKERGNLPDVLHCTHKQTNRHNLHIILHCQTIPLTSVQ